MTGDAYVEVGFGGRTVTLSTPLPSDDGLIVTSEGIKGWHGTPDAKVSMTEMQTGDGAHAVEEEAVLYAARTVTIGWAAIGDGRDEALSGLAALLSSAHKLVRLRVVDSTSDTYAVGYTQVSDDSGVRTKDMTGQLTVVCADPRRYASQVKRAQLLPGAKSPGGLFYGKSGSGLVYPLRYGETGPTAMATLVNAGTAPAYPVITVTGHIYPNLRISHAGGAVAFGGDVGNEPLVLDSLTRTASVGGADASRLLTRRSFPVIPPGGSVTLSAAMIGTGWATVEWHDTYI